MSLRWEGINEYLAELHDLPKELTAEASAIVASAAREAFAEAYAGYPVGPAKGTRMGGALRAGLTIRVAEDWRSEFGTAVRLVNVAPHAYIFEHGSEARHTDLGYHRGSMPPGHVFYPAVNRATSKMYARLVALVQRETGAEVRVLT